MLMLSEEKMATAKKDMNKQIESLVEMTESILRGEFKECESDIDAEGMLSILANKINKLLVNMKNVETPLTSAGQHAPNAVSNAKNVIDLMARATGQVLDNADQLVEDTESLETLLGQCLETRKEIAVPFEKHITGIKAGLFDIIGSQSYQDVARQKLEALIEDLNQIRDWLVEVLVILNIRKDNSPENVQKKTSLLRGVSEAATPEDLKQDLVDDLLSEFGF
jgi:chemotaxis regulatin CheY-phosphate phosphatase CheZ